MTMLRDPLLKRARVPLRQSIESHETLDLHGDPGEHLDGSKLDGGSDLFLDVRFGDHAQPSVRSASLCDQIRFQVEELERSRLGRSGLPRVAVITTDAEGARVEEHRDEAG